MHTLKWRNVWAAAWTWSVSASAAWAAAVTTVSTTGAGGAAAAKGAPPPAPTAVGPASVLAAKAYTGAGLRATYLRCEYRVDPLGIGETKPRLSWVVESGRRSQQQTAWRVLVASSAGKLAQNVGDLWDSGRVAGDETVAVPYGGRALASGQQAHWKVMVWDKDGQASPWSSAARWSLGLLQPSDWQAQWIGFDAPRALPERRADFGSAQWVWFAGDPALQAPAGKRVFLNTVTVPELDQIAAAELLVTADDTISLNLNGERLMVTEAGDGGWRKARLLDVTRQLRAGANEWRATVENAAPGAAGFLFRLTVTTKDGRKIELCSDATWRATDKPTAQPANEKVWTPARVLGAYGMAPWGDQIQAGAVVLPPAVHLRTQFTVKKPVARAVLYATALGWCDAYLNGARVNADRFIPGWTDYRRRVYYRAYDVTAALKTGENALGAVLSDGWYSGYIGWYGRREHYGVKPRFLGQLVIEHGDGSTTVVATGPGWTAGTGPILGADILQGERYDARREDASWVQPGFAIGPQWKSVDVGAEVQPVVQPHPGPKVEAVAAVPVQTITEPKPGVYVLDLGQNFAGVVRLRVKGQAGQTITLRHAERLNPDGTIYTTNLRTAQATDTYTCRGGRGEEVWEPRFTFHGFQYVEITGLTAKPTPETITGLALSSATPPAGDFETNDPMVNRLVRNVRWTQAMNFIDVPTDCPQRDERMGWTGDAQVYVRTATLNNDVQAFFTKWLIDLDDAQRADGQYPKVAPLVQGLEDGGPAWQEVGVICPWTIYEVYGDRRLLEQHYPAMVRFIEFCRARSTPELLPPAKYHCYGDWLSIKADTPKEVIYTAYFAYAAQLMARSAEVLGRTDDAAKYRELAARIKAAFQRAYVAADGKIKGHTQAVYVLALAYDLVEGEAAKAAANYLVADIEERGGRLSTGFIGTKDLMLALAKIGRNDVAYRLLHSEEFPGWGFSIKHGATSIWERWDGWTPDKGFQTPGMNSFAHYSFGAVYQWMVENIGGIRAAAPGYAKIVVAPNPGGKLTQAKIGYHSVRGRIATEWQRAANGVVRYTITIPANTTALISLPAASPSVVTERGKGLKLAESVKVVGSGEGRVQMEVGSGRYEFVVDPAN